MVHSKTFNIINKYTELLLFFVLVLYTVIFNNHSFYYDEPYYLYNVKLLNEIGFNDHFLTILHGPAGPLQALMYWPLQGITGNTVLGTRLINIVFLFFIILLAKSIYKSIYPNQENNRGWSLGLMCIPMVYVCSGLALTEVPALLMLTLSLFFLVRSDINRIDYRWILSAACLSLAIIGRQPYLLLAPLFAIWIFYKLKNKKFPVVPIIYIVISLILPCYIFMVWKNIVPVTGGDIANKGFLKPKFLFLGLGYSFLLTFLLDRKLLIKVKRSQLGYIFLAFLISIAACYVLHFGQPLMNTVASKIIPAGLFSYYEIVIAAILVMIGCWFLISMCRLGLNSLDQPDRLLLIVCLLIMIGSCAKITHQFSSRYVFQASLFFLLIVEPGKKDKIQYLLSVAGGIVGMLSLYSYHV